MTDSLGIHHDQLVVMNFSQGGDLVQLGYIGPADKQDIHTETLWAAAQQTDTHTLRGVAVWWILEVDSFALLELPWFLSQQLAKRDSLL